MKKNILILFTLIAFMPFFSMSAKADFNDSLKSGTGVIAGVGIGPVVGCVRGLSSGWLKGTKATAKALGNESGLPHNTVGFISGGVVGGAGGAVSGILMGAYDGIKYGIDDPWSPENFSAGGVDLLDYEPFDWK